jgi:hypothetical protein
MKFGLLLFGVAFFLISCEKAITIETGSKEPLLVVDASIENGQAPIVVLSRSLDYFSSITPEILASSIIKGAQVSVSDGTRQVQLKEYNIPISANYSLTYYTTDTTNPAAGMIGQQEKSYQLQVAVENKNYTASTTIPKLTKKIDSLWWIPSPARIDTNRVWIMAKIIDPAGLGNYIRYFTSVNRLPYYPGDNSVFDDQIVDGTTYDVQVEQGKDRNNPEFHRRSFSKGDTATVKFTNIDKTTFDFWRTLEFSYQSVGNPFASPIKVLGNVSNGALGAFSGYSAQYITLIIPK